MNERQVAAGAVFLAASSVSLLETGVVSNGTPLLVGAITSLGIAVGALVIRSGRDTT